VIGVHTPEFAFEMKLDWTVALFFRPDITRVELHVEREQVKQARQLVESSNKRMSL